jgi:multidrug transporter EmrE-like cation transporter
MTKPMTLFLTAGLAVLATILYHLFQRLTPPDANPALALVVTYGSAISATLCLFAIYPVRTLTEAFAKLNWASIALGAAVLGIELGVLLAYRAGWQISVLALVINGLSALGLTLIGVIFFKDKLSIINIVGVLLCLTGLVMINWKK